MKDNNDTRDLQNFETGGEEQPAINKYAGTEGAAAPKISTQPAVNPKDTPPQKPDKKEPPANPEARRKAILGCLGAFGSIMLIFLIFGFVFLTTAGAQQSTIARVLGINQASFINGLITFIHIIFIFISLVAFLFTMIGLFRASMAKKGDTIAKKSGLRMSLVSGSVLIAILVAWGFSFIYLDGKRIKTGPAYQDPIVTTPENTLNLSAPVEVIFDARNVQIDRRKYELVAEEWDFGDETSSTGQIASHIYEAKGIYEVVLTVTVKDKKTGELQEIGQYNTTVSITNEALSAIFSADPQSGEAPLKVSFDAGKSVDPDGNIDRYEWDLDGNNDFADARGAQIEETFEKVGRYRVSLRVVSTTGEHDVAEKEINVVEAQEVDAVIAIADEPETFEMGINYVFKAEESVSPNGSIEKYEWDFGDESPLANTKTASHIFEKEGTFEVTLKVTDEKGEEGTETKLVQVGAKKGVPKAKITTDPELGNAVVLEGRVPFTVVFDGRSSSDSDNNIVDYIWSFDDPGSYDGFGDSVSHTFNTVGTYTATLTVNDGDNNSNTASLIVKVLPQGIVAAVSADRVDGTVPLTIAFDASASTYKEGRITSYRWNFGDGTPERLGDAKISHKYTVIGNYTVTVTVIGADTSTNIAQLAITVREIALKACYTTALSGGPAPFETAFDPGCSTGTVTGYFWDFGDGGTSTAVKPSHTFQTPGEYEVNLEVTDADNTVDKFSRTIKVTTAE